MVKSLPRSVAKGHADHQKNICFKLKQLVLATKEKLHYPGNIIFDYQKIKTDQYLLSLKTFLNKKKNDFDQQ